MNPDLAQRVLEGDVRSASRLMRLIDDRDPSAMPMLKAIFPRTGKAYVVGITGPPGAGKSTLTDRLIAHLRKAQKRVGVLAVDPTSPFTGGAILGDRIRMQGHATDPNVFIRSLATRGHLGGVSRATADCIRVMDAMGQEVILVETVGVGQDEIEIAQLAHTTAVVLVPGMGDDVQAIKAGILEVADLLVINKADLEGADRVAKELRQMLELRHAAGSADGWEPPIVKTVAAKDQGVVDLWDAVAAHRAFLAEGGGARLEQRERARARVQLLLLLKETLLDRALEQLEHNEGGLTAIVADIAHRRADPYALAEELVQRLS